MKHIAYFKAQLVSQYNYTFEELRPLSDRTIVMMWWSLIGDSEQ